MHVFWLVQYCLEGGMRRTEVNWEHNNVLNHGSLKDAKNGSC